MGQIWDLLVNGFSDLIQFCYGLTADAGWANYGLAIILMTLLIKVVLYPLTHSSMKSMREMQALQPKLKEMQARYKDTPEKLQAETMKLYQEHGVNPLGGCLPILLQMPIILAFYKALSHMEYKVIEHAGFLWVPNLSKPDPWLLLPLLAGLTTFLQQKISTVDTKDPTQRTMLFVMPVFIAYIAWKMAAGLALYWVVFNLLSIVQQLYINRTSSTALVPAGIEEKPVVPEKNVSEETVKKIKGGKKRAGNRETRKKR